ncbi:hypothetical protein AVEN_151274-1, partial [Araneus ventricosus]
SEIP